MLPDQFKNTLTLPIVVAPMFLISGPKLVIECCKAGLVGTFPALNQRSSEEFEQWLIQIKQELDEHAHRTGRQPAPFGVNLIVHKSNSRLQADLELCIKHRVPLIITSLGAVPKLVAQVHAYGGLVFHDVINIAHARKAAAANVDGLIAVCAGAGGHAGTLSPFALVSEIRRFFYKTVLLAGCINRGNEVAAAQMLGADLAYMGTRFINTEESMACDSNKHMILESSAADIVYTPEISGVNANFMRKSLEQAGLDPERLQKHKEAQGVKGAEEHKAWKNIWSAGQGVGTIDDILSVTQLIQRLQAEYRQANDAQRALAKKALAAHATKNSLESIDE